MPESGIEGVHIFEQGQHGAAKLELLGQKGFLPLSCRLGAFLPLRHSRDEFNFERATNSSRVSL